MPGAGTVTERTRRPPLVRLPELTAAAVAQMALDEGLLLEARQVTVRRYRWSPPAVSLGKFQRLPAAPSGDAAERSRTLPFDLVRRPSGGRAVLHGDAFEWSFSVVFPAGWDGAGEPARDGEDAVLAAGRDRPRGGRVDDAYGIVSSAMAAALSAAGVAVSSERGGPYRRSSLCLSTSLRHDLHTRHGKIVAVAQVRREGATLVHGSVLVRRPPADLVAALETLVGEPWRGEGLEAAASIDGDAVWVSFNGALSERLDDLATKRRGDGR